MSFFQPNPVCRGRRVIIDLPAKKCWPEYRKFLIRNEKFHRPWVYHTAENALYFNKYLNSIKQGFSKGFFVREADSAQLVGVINIHKISFGALRSGTLGYYGDGQCTGKGLMAEAMALILKYAREKMAIYRLEANIQPENLISINFIKKQGFIYEGFCPKYLEINGKWRDHERWAIIL